MPIIERTRHRKLPLLNYSRSKKDQEWTAEQEREAFLYTSKMNATRNFSQFL